MRPAELVRKTMRCTYCNTCFTVWSSRGDTTEQAYRVHLTNCKALRKDNEEKYCKHLGPASSKTVKCGGCGGGERQLFTCQLNRMTLPFVTESFMRRHQKDVMGIFACATCPDYVQVSVAETSAVKLTAVDMATDPKQASSHDVAPKHIESNRPMGIRNEDE